MTFAFGSRSGTGVALVLFVGMFAVLGVAGAVALELRREVMVPRYLTAAGDVPTARVSDVGARATFKGRWRRHVRDTDGQTHDSATASRVAVEGAATQVRAVLHARGGGQSSSPAVVQAHAMDVVRATRIAQNPLITVASSPSLGGNVNGPTVIRVPAWVERPLGRYYMYFANHMGDFIRMAYADAPTGPWTIHEPGVLHVRDTAFFRPQPDPKDTLADFYTHVASPEVFVDDIRRRIVLWAHGWWTQGERWPSEPAAARVWARQKGYGQYTQVAESADGVRFATRTPITKTSYLRVFRHDGLFYGVSRLGVLSRAADPLRSFEAGPNPFSNTRYANRVRHVAVLQRGTRLHVFFTAIGDAPERVLVSSIDLTGDWTTWRASEPLEVLRPEAPYECADLPMSPSLGGDIDVPAHQIRDPFVFEEAGRLLLYYSTCGEQGIAAAALDLP